jgi:hypothetical protein
MSGFNHRWNASTELTNTSNRLQNFMKNFQRFSNFYMQKDGPTDRYVEGNRHIVATSSASAQGTGLAEVVLSV